MSSKILLPLLLCAQIGLAHALPKEADCADPAKAKAAVQELNKKQADEQREEVQRREKLEKLMEKNPALAKLSKEQRAKFMLGLLNKPEFKALADEKQKAMEGVLKAAGDASNKQDGGSECRNQLMMAQMADKTKSLNQRENAMLEKEINSAK